jgi:hypothetical protein
MDKAFEAAYAEPLAFLIAILVAGGMVMFLLRTALVPESRFTGWVRSLTGRNGRWAFLILLLLWGAAMASLQAFPAQAEGGLALIGLLAGFFLFMGFVWSVIGE